MSRRRHADTYYQIIIDLPSGQKEQFEYIDNLQAVANILNNKYFNKFEVVTRTMVSNWVHYPDKPRREYANSFRINRINKAM